MFERKVVDRKLFSKRKELGRTGFDRAVFGSRVALSGAEVKKSVCHG